MGKTRHFVGTTNLILQKMAGFPKIASTLLIGKKMEDLKTKYGYLDNLLLIEGWLWEFIRRKGKYRETFKELKKELQDAEITSSGVSFSPQESHLNLNTTPSIREKLELLENEFGIKPHPRANPDNAKGYYIKQIEGGYNFLALPDYHARYYDEDIFPFPIIKARPIAVTKFREEAKKLPPAELHQYCHTLIEKISITDKSKMLYLGIALNARKEDLWSSFDFILNKYVEEEPAERYNKFKKWKLYLIYYDLYLPEYSIMKEKQKKGITVYDREIKRKIAHTVKEAFPEDTNDWKPEKEKDWWRYVHFGFTKAKELIMENGYRKYLFL